MRKQTNITSFILISFVLCFLWSLPFGQANIVYDVAPPVEKKKAKKKQGKQRKVLKKQQRKNRKLKITKEQNSSQIAMLLILIGAILCLVVGAFLLIFGFGIAELLITGLILLGVSVFTELCYLIATTIGRNGENLLFGIIAIFYTFFSLIIGVTFLILALGFGFPSFFWIIGVVLLVLILINILFFFLANP